MKTVTFRELKHLWPVYLLVLPALGLILTFSYYPAASAIYHAFFRWNGDEISEFVGWKNFLDAFGDPVLAKSFVLVMIFIAANLVKMVPSIITAVVIHRLTSDKWRYLYRVAFVIPMIIPGMVWLLLWKYFYDPTIGPLNKILRATGLMSALNWLDTTMPWLADVLGPQVNLLIDPIFGSLWGFGLFGGLILAALSGLKGFYKGWLWWIAILVGGWYLWGPGARGFSLFALLMGQADFGGMSGLWAGLAHMGALIAAVIVPGEFLRRGEAGRVAIKRVAGFVIVLFAALVLLSATWTEPTGAFTPQSSPSWLGQKDLIRPAIIFWGFPWVGVVSVLLYLSGLGNIDQSVYEAADIDGCGPIRKFWNIELPLITTQIRLNLVLMIINTLKGWGLVFILLGDTGGPGGVGMLPGLYMFRKAFRDTQVGYACAIGLLLFFLIVYLTIINNKYVRVSK